MSNKSNQPTEWGDCPQGEVSTMVRRIRTRRRTVFAMQLGGCAVLGLLLGVAFLEFRTSMNRSSGYGGITCAEVHDHADLFVKGTLEGDLQERITAHLKECRPCSRLIERKRSAELRPETSQERQTVFHVRPLPLATKF